MARCKKKLTLRGLFPDEKGESEMKLVVIDDEIRQCRSMKKIMERLFPEFSVEIFTDPASAIEYVEREGIKIIVTDICMPDIDGLTLVQMLMESDSSRKIILLSGYAEFEYARKAISVGAYDYLLKPMDPDKLREVVVRCIREVREEMQSKEEHSEMHRQLDMAWPVYMENLMNQWLIGKLTTEEKDKIKQIFPENKYGFMVLTRFFGFDHWKEKSGSQEVILLKNKLGLNMREQMGPSYHSFSFFSASLPETMVTLVFPKLYGRGYPAWMENQGLTKEFFPEFARAEGNGMQMGVGIYVENLEREKKTAYEGAVEALEYAFYFPKGNVCLRREIDSELKGQVRIGLHQEEQLFDALKNAGEEEVLDCMDEILEGCIAENYPAPDELMAEISRMINHAAMHQVYPHEFYCPPAESTYLSYDGFRDAVHTYLKEFCREIRLRDEGKKSGFVRKFQDYMKEHYMKNISLEDVAGEFMLSSSYCSRLIKESMGSNFTQLLIEERMRKAKELLKYTDLRIYEIAIRIGYSDVKYFNRVFKTSVGMTPQQFRREISGGRT